MTRSDRDEGSGGGYVQSPVKEEQEENEVNPLKPIYSQIASSPFAEKNLHEELDRVQTKTGVGAPPVVYYAKMKNEGLRSCVLLRCLDGWHRSILRKGRPPK